MALIKDFIQTLIQQQNGVFIVFFTGLILGALLIAFLRGQRVKYLMIENQELTMTLRLERQSNEQLDELLDQARYQLADTFSQLSTDALKRNNEQFLQLAEENLKRHQSEAKAELSTREQAIEQLVKPISEALNKTSAQINTIEKERKESYGQLYSTIKHLNEGQQNLKQETQNLVQALRRPEVRGQWGEMTLRRLAELSGMVAHCDFFEQTSQITDSGLIRPDMIVRLPDNREIIVDAKTPLDAYLSSIQTTDDILKASELRRHVQIIRQRSRELAAKNYWAEYSQSPEFVVMFIPGEHFLSAALELEPQLLEETMQLNIILATPTNFIAILRAVSYGWKQQALTENAIAIRNLGESLYKRLSVFSGHLDKLGSSLNSSVGHFNKTVGSLERQVIPSGKRFLDMGIRAKDELDSIPPIDNQVRPVSSPEDDQIN
jgi:DNA recombination protein RmuC|tara:strand:+ start:12525 stop:13829 length:1305 start_codon:yes stop_codon:yes gene_type:complete